MRKLYLALMAIVVVGLVIPGCTQKQPNKAPTAVFVATANAVNVGSQIIFDAANSTDKDGKIVRYHWDFGDMMEDLGVSVVHTFVNGGNYTVTLMVTDNEGAKDKTNITVHVNEYPKARIDAGLTEVKIFAPVSLSAVNSSDPDGTIVKCLWDFGDGTNTTGTTVSHPYNDVGTYTVNLTVRDDFGAENSKSVDIIVILRCFELSWSIVKHSLSQVSDDSRENSTLNKTISIPHTNMTLVEFQLTWRDDIPQITITGLKPNDDFKLKVSDPSNNTQSCKDMNENITLNFSLSEAPAVLNVRAKDTAGAMAQLTDKYTKNLGKGDWVISVIVGDCGGAQGILPSDLDTGNSWKLDVRYSQYELVVTEK